MAQNFKGPHHGPTVWVELERGHVQVLKKSTLESVQGENETPDLKQTPLHKKEGWTARHCPQEKEVVTPASLDDYLAGVLRICQLHLVL